MRQLTSYDENGNDLLSQLREGEKLLASGAAFASEEYGGTIYFFYAANNEDYLEKDIRLNHRRQMRKGKRDRFEYKQ